MILAQSLHLGKNPFLLRRKNLIDKILNLKPKKNNPFFSISNKAAGESYKKKIEFLSDYLKTKKADYIFISAAENIA